MLHCLEKSRAAAAARMSKRKMINLSKVWRYLFYLESRTSPLLGGVFAHLHLGRIVAPICIGPVYLMYDWSIIFYLLLVQYILFMIGAQKLTAQKQRSNLEVAFQHLTSLKSFFFAFCNEERDRHFDGDLFLVCVT
jgi:hypothetical protein